MFDEVCARQHRANYFALNADALAVDDSHAAEALATRLAQILFDDRAHLSRPYRVKVEHVAYLKPHRLRERVERVNVAQVFVIALGVRSALSTRDELTYQSEHSRHREADSIARLL